MNLFQARRWLFQFNVTRSLDGGSNTSSDSFPHPDKIIFPFHQESVFTKIIVQINFIVHGGKRHCFHHPCISQVNPAPGSPRAEAVSLNNSQIPRPWLCNGVSGLLVWIVEELFAIFISHHFINSDSERT